MAKLAIKGHETRGKEVIEILEMLGGINTAHPKGVHTELAYYIEADRSICCIDFEFEYHTGFYKITLEEFLEKFPYKVGDKVSSKYLKNYEISKMEWESVNNRVIYKLQGMGWYSVDELQPYKEEDMKTITIDDFKANTKEWLIDKLGNMSKDNALQTINNIYDELHKPKYPKTYEECCKVLGYSGNYNMILTTDVDNKLFNALYRLKVCRDAYWKIAGEEMGLGKPWKPIWSIYEHKFCLGTDKDKVIEECVTTGNRILAFPTAEIRDAYKENFDNDIEACKEFL